MLGGIRQHTHRKSDDSFYKFKVATSYEEKGCGDIEN
jgi:hypothetical protein